jgi:hypothetical protein
MDVTPGVLSSGPSEDARYVSNDGFGTHAPMQVRLRASLSVNDGH